jgi:hypothetical protein
VRVVPISVVDSAFQSRQLVFRQALPHSDRLAKRLPRERAVQQPHIDSRDVLYSIRDKRQSGSVA